jgi:hypothetical protein
MNVISATIDISGQQYNIDMAEPRLFAEWAVGILSNHYPLPGDYTQIRTRYVGPWS